jgi:hypothetical protein
MATATPEVAAFERGVRPVIDLILPQTADELVTCKPDPQLAKRIEERATKCTAGALTPDEQAEYEGYVRANKFVAVMQRQARRRAAMKE